MNSVKLWYGFFCMLRYYCTYVYIYIFTHHTPMKKGSRIYKVKKKKRNTGSSDICWTINNIYSAPLRIWFMRFEKQSHIYRRYVCAGIIVRIDIYIFVLYVFLSHSVIGMHFGVSLLFPRRRRRRIYCCVRTNGQNIPNEFERKSFAWHWFDLLDNQMNPFPFKLNGFHKITLAQYDENMECASILVNWNHD